MRRSKAPEAPPAAAVGYARVSTEEQAKFGISLDAQDERIRAYCTMAGLTLAWSVRDEGVSAAKPLDTRPGGHTLNQYLARAEASHVVALKLDRLFRDAIDALSQIKRWEQSAVTLHIVDLGGATVNTSTAIGRMFLTVLAGLAEFERNLIRERITAAMVHLKVHRKVYCRVMPYGFEAVDGQLVPIDAEQAAIERMRAWRSEGLSLAGIAAQLNAESVPAKQGGRWHPSTVGKVLANSLHDPRG